MTIVQRDGLAGPVDAPSARVSARGRHVVFASHARLVPQDISHVRDVYVFDLETGQLTLESSAVRGTVANGDSSSPGISGDGRYVVFVSSAGNLAEPQIPPGMPRLFLRDRETETTRLLATSLCAIFCRGARDLSVTPRKALPRDSMIAAPSASSGLTSLGLRSIGQPTS